LLITKKESRIDILELLINRTLSFFVLLFLLLGSLSAAERPFQPATITDIQRKTNTRVLYYVVNTPITKDEPYFEISLQINDKVYLGRYVPRHADEALPDEWKPGFAVQSRLDGRHLFLKRPSGSEMQLTILKTSTAKSSAANAEAGTAPK
jgi:hypothetical protein